MKQSEVKVGAEIISPYDTIWVIVKKYSRTLVLIKNTVTGQLAALTSGQFRLFKVLKETPAAPTSGIESEV